MRERLGIGDRVDGCEVNIAVINRSTHDVASDAAEAVDAYLDGHSSSEGVWDCGRASQANSATLRNLKCYGLRQQKSTRPAITFLGQSHCGYCLMLVTLSPINRTNTVLEGGWP